MKVISFDPGKKIGFVSVETADTKIGYKIMACSNLDYDTFNEWIKEKKEYFDEADACVIEEYRVLPGMAKAHAGSKLETARALGAIKLMCDLTNTKVYMSSAANNKVNLKSAGLADLVKDHNSTHWVYALAHAIMFLRRLRLIK